MSLLIVGSCSRVTQGIIQRLARQKTYERITVADLLPLYDFHQRFYRLKKQLSSQQLSTKVDLVKIFQLTELNQAIHSHNDLLFVTHDYFSSVTSKTKLMEVTAQLSAQKRAVFAAPLEYDHYGFTDPQTHFQESRQKSVKANPNATFVRGDIQDSTEFLAFLHAPKSLIAQKFSSVPSSFQPKIASSETFNDAVIEALKGGSKGETHLINGQIQNPLQVAYNKEIQVDQVNHHCQNVSNIFKKYRSLPTAASKAF